jgi:hypothetical protein
VQKVSENHPAWQAWNIHQSQFSYTKSSSKKLYDQDKDTGDPELMRVLKQYAHDMGMVKDLLVVMLNLLEQHGKSLQEHSDILEETADMIDLLITFNSDEE